MAQARLGNAKLNCSGASRTVGGAHRTTVAVSLTSQKSTRGTVGGVFRTTVALSLASPIPGKM